MPKLRSLSASLCALFGFALLASCQPAAPELIDIFDLSPAQVETDDTVVLRGAGYPPGEAGVLELKGTVYRAGSDDEPIAVSVAVRSETEERVVWNMAPKLVAAFTSTEEGQRHATFRGTATLAFAPARQGAPPIHGSAAVVLDVFPPKAAAEAALADRELLEFYGAELERAGQGVKVTSVVPEGRLARAGVQASDVILSFGGLRTHTPSDLLPKAGQREARIEVVSEPLSAGQTPALLGVDVEGFQPQLARRWQWGLALLGALGALLLLSQSRWAQALGWLKTRLLAARNETNEPRLARADARKEERLPRGFSGFLAVSALFAAAKLDLLPRAKDLDLALLYFALATLDFVTAFLAAGVQRNRWSLWRALLGWVHCLPRQLALALALLAVVLERGSLALPIEQPASTWQLQAFASPCAFVAAAALLALALSKRFASRPDGSATGRRVKLSAAERAVSTLGGVSSLLLLAITQVLLFSGFDIPGLGQGSRVLPVIAFQLQFTVVYVASLLLERSLPGVGRKGVLGLDVRLLLPMAALSLLLAPVWLAEVWAPWIRECVSLGLKVGVVLLFSVALLTLLRARGRTLVAHGVNPWL